MQLAQFHRFAIFPAALFVLGGFATTVEAREPLSPEALAKLSGIDKALDDIADSMAEQGSQIAQNGEAMGAPEAFVASWRKAAQTTFAPQKLKASLAKSFAGKLSPKEALAVEDFYKSPVGQRIVTAEVEAGSLAGQEQMKAEAATVMQALLADKMRKAAIDAIAKAIHLEEMTTALSLNVSRAVMIGLTSADPNDTRMTLDDIEEAIQQQKATITSQMGAVVTLSLAFAYRSLPIEDLNAYVAFLKTGPGAKFSNVTLKALDAVMSEAGLAFGRALSSDLKRQPI